MNDQVFKKFQLGIVVTDDVDLVLSGIISSYR